MPDKVFIILLKETTAMREYHCQGNCENAPKPCLDVNNVCISISQLYMAQSIALPLPTCFSLIIHPAVISSLDKQSTFQQTFCCFVVQFCSLCVHSRHFVMNIGELFHSDRSAAKQLHNQRVMMHRFLKPFNNHT